MRARRTGRFVGLLVIGRRVFLDHMRAINDLQKQPEFYNTPTTNCTNVYESGRFGRDLPFDELKKRSHVNAAARAANDAPDSSERIRAGRPSVVPRQ